MRKTHTLVENLAENANNCGEVLIYEAKCVIISITGM